MSVAIIGFGSLIWDPAGLSPNVKAPWQRGAGPVLPLEFSRISPKRRESLVVVIDPVHGRPCPTSYILSARSTLESAVADLATREHAPVNRIGFVCRRTRRSHGRFAAILAAIMNWTGDRDLDGAVWTDLEANFTSRTGLEFTVSNGLSYLKALDPNGLGEAKRYIDRAPEESDTPLRRALAAEPWWQALPRPWEEAAST